MPDLDNLAKKVKGSWRNTALRAAVSDAQRQPDDSTRQLGQALMYVLSRCALTYAGVQLLPEFSRLLGQLACLPLQERQTAMFKTVFPQIPEGKEAVVKAARRVGILICDGQVEVEAVPLALATQFLHVLPEAEFFGLLTSEGYPKPFPTEAAAAAALNQAKAELTQYIAGAAPEFASSMFTTLPIVNEPELVRRDTAAQMETLVTFNLDLLNDDDDEE